MVFSLLVLGLSAKLYFFWQARFGFDDAYMYCRYAYNFRHGWGIAWNPGGPHTFGITSLPWLFVILAGSYAVHDNASLLTGASCCTGLLAISFLGWAASRRAKCKLLQNPLLVSGVIAVLLLLNWRFAESWCNGMETMLALLSVAAFESANDRFRIGPDRASFLAIVLCAVLCTAVRPELLLVAISLPATSWAMQERPRPLRTLLQYFGTTFASLAVVLLLNWRYFGTPVPLAFYLKAMHGYDGYRLYINPLGYLAIFLGIGLPALLVLAALSRREHVRMLLVYLVPLTLESLYLTTVTQIMGAQARYYVPLLPLLFVPAFLLLDQALVQATPLRFTPKRVAAVLCAVLLNRDYTQQITTFLGNRAAARRVYYAKPVFSPQPSPELPQGEIWKRSAQFARLLPAGTTMAATEVGILGASAPKVQIIDLAGLNDNFLARHPSDTEYVLQQAPDVIWLPHADYTKLYGSLASSPQLLRDYDVYAGALNFGLAIRKSSRRKPAFASAVQQAWSQLYSGYPMENYRVQRIVWDSQVVVHGEPTDVLE